jgi:hypothetical protein
MSFPSKLGGAQFALKVQTLTVSRKKINLQSIFFRDSNHIFHEYSY